MNCEYYSLNKAYGAPSVVKESFQVPTKKYNMSSLTTYNYMDKLRLPHRIHESMKPALDNLVKDHSVPSKNILHFRDATFSSYDQPPTSVFIQLPSKDVPLNSYIFISTPSYPYPHFSHVIGSPEGYSDYSKRHQYAEYRLLVLDKDGYERTDLVKKQQTDLIFLELDNKAIPSGSAYKNDKLGVFYIFVRRPTDAQVPVNPTTLKQVVDSKIPAMKLVISFS